MKLYIKAALQLLAKNWKSLVLFECIYRFLTAAAMLAGTNILMKFCLGQMGYSYLTAENYQAFICAPITILCIVAGVILLGLAISFEINAVFSCYENSWRKKKISVLFMVYAGVQGTIRFVKRYPMRWILYILASAPALCCMYLITAVSQTKFLIYTVQQIFLVIPHEKMLVFLLLLVFLLSLLFSYSMPFWIMTEERSAKIYQRIRGIVRKAWKRELLKCLMIQLGAMLITVVLYLLLMLLMVAGVMVFKSQSTRISAVLAYSSQIRSLCGVVSGAVGMIFSLLYYYTFFVRSDRQRIYRSQKYRRRLSFRLCSDYRLSKIFVCGMIVVELFYAVFALRPNLSQALDLKDVPEVSAHRGGAKMAPENTLSAIAYAVDAMADYAEIDVQETKDGEIVLLHDTNLKRTTGLSANIWTLDYEEVAALDAGVKFHKKFLGEKIPTLEEVIQFAKGKIRLNIEVKYNGHNQNIVKKVMQIIEDNDFIDECVLTSMNYKFLKQAKKINPAIRTGYTLQITYGDIQEIEYADFFSIKHTYITEDLVTRIHALGKEVHTWTLNYQGDMQRVLNCGVDNIITDEPELVRKVMLGENNRNPSFLSLWRYAIRG